MAGGGKLVSRLAQMPKIQKGISYFRKARTALANSHLGMLARESYGATKNFFTSRFGNLWDDFSRKTYPHHEVNLENRKRLDSYDPTVGEIISRKATDLDRIQEETFRGYLQELQDKYSVGETIRSNKYPEIDGLKLDGKHILEIPDSNKHLPDIEKFKEIEKEYGVELRFTKE